ncbi:MAG: hypothetical protein F6J89_02160 [Symploca sp. SIO1C4]|uniref:Transposase n=1 Tax=Symploca sp. SIO1C4 TaxID=2607765 RepID=A0A6B3N6M3_9CYAN|nr:hypothetical protein [Symploca sp. SIO1C4]
MSKLQGWKLTQRIIKSGFNRQVKQYFKDIKSDTRQDRGRAVLKNSLLIQDHDSALEVLNKQIHFYLGLQDNRVPIATIPDYWVERVGADRPQLVVIYRPKFKQTRRTGNYELTIPHYLGDKHPKLPEYKKGNWRGSLILKDNSRLVVNGASITETERVIKALKRYIKPEYLPGTFKIGQVKNSPFLELEVRPLRADYYSKGQKQAEPDWRCYCS